MKAPVRCSVLIRCSSNQSRTGGAAGDTTEGSDDNPRHTHTHTHRGRFNPLQCSSAGLAAARFYSQQFCQLRAQRHLPAAGAYFRCPMLSSSRDTRVDYGPIRSRTRIRRHLKIGGNIRTFLFAPEKLRAYDWLRRPR